MFKAHQNQGRTLKKTVLRKISYLSFQRTAVQRVIYISISYCVLEKFDENNRNCNNFSRNYNDVGK